MCGANRCLRFCCGRVERIVGELRICGASDDLVEFSGVWTEEYGCYNETPTFGVGIKDGDDCAAFVVGLMFGAEGVDGWTMTVLFTANSANIPVDFRFDQEGADNDPVLVVQIPDGAELSVERLDGGD